MSLQVWLPLNGNLDNQGLASVTINSNNISYDEGKIGKAAQFNNSYIGIDNTPLTGSIEDFSLCFWLKISSTSSAMCLYNGRTATGKAIALFILEGGAFRFDDGKQHTLSYTVPTNKWEHYCFTRNASQIKLYVNGELKITTASTSYSTTATKATIGASSTNTTTGKGNTLLGFLNDYRIYDHCLSEKEVREIAKGLVLHYKLNGNGSGGENLIKNSMTTVLNNYHDYTGKATLAKLDSDGTTVTKAYAITFPADTETYSNYNLYVSFARDTTKAVQQDGKTYTLSFKVKASKALSAYSFNYEYLAKSVSVNVTTSWQTVQITGVASGTYSALYVCSGQTNRNKINGGILYIADLKLEEGSRATAWSPNPTDAEYFSYGYGDNIEQDCSGFGNNGTKTGTITKDTNSPRYDGCYKFNNDSYIEHPALPSMNYATYSFWVKQSSFTGYGMIYGQKNNPGSGNIPWFAENTESAPAWAYFGNNSPNYTRGSGSLLTTNTWYHLCYVWNNGIAKWYINGVPNATQVTYTTRTNISNGVIGTIGDSYTGTSWSGTSFSGNISDFRIYATALSDDDIKELYENKISIDSKENLWAYEFIEE